MANKELNKILLVEDEVDIQTVAKYALERVGNFQVKYCYCGNEALECAESFAPDLILLDVMMPKMDGITALKKLREIPALKDTPVIFMTAKVQAGEVSRYNELNILGVILKPFNAMTLADDLRAKWTKYQEQRTSST